MPVLPKHAIDRDKFDASPSGRPGGQRALHCLAGATGPTDHLQTKSGLLGRGHSEPTSGSTISIRSRSNTSATEQAQFEAFKKGVFDVFMEGDPNKWATSYDFPAVKDGRVDTGRRFETKSPANMFGFAFNTRRDKVCTTGHVRDALALMFDFEWTNRNLYASRYQRMGSYWQGSELSALGKPADATERALLAALSRCRLAGSDGRNLRTCQRRMAPGATARR